MSQQQTRTTGRLTQAALTAAEAGHYMFPVGPRSKLPAVRNWEQAATRDPERIRAIWARHPYNLGLAVGRAGLVVIDLDERDGAVAPPHWAGARGGRDVLARLAADAGQPFPGDTYTVKSPSGWHLYFQAPTGVRLRNTAGEHGNGIGWNIDTRSGGGYVLGAGSVRDQGYYRVVNRAPIAPLPAWLTAALTPPPPPRPVTPVAMARAEAYVRAAIAAETARVSEAGTGYRHHTLLAAAIKLGTLVGAGALNENDAANALHTAAAGYIGVDHYTARQVERDINDGLTYGAANPRHLATPGR